MTGATEPSTTFVVASAVKAASTAANVIKKPPPNDDLTVSAEKPAAEPARTRSAVHVIQRKTGRSVSRRGRSTNTPAAPTIAAGSGPSVTAAKTKTSDPID